MDDMMVFTPIGNEVLYPERGIRNAIQRFIEQLKDSGVEPSPQLYQFYFEFATGALQ